MARKIVIISEYDHSDNMNERWENEKEMYFNFGEFEKCWADTNVDNITTGDGFPAEVIVEWFEYKGHGKFDVYRKIEEEEYLKERKPIEKWVEECSSAIIREIENG